MKQTQTIVTTKSIEEEDVYDIIDIDIDIAPITVVLC